jgi:hypothetical protein
MSLFSLSSSARREVLVRASNLESVLRWVSSMPGQQGNAATDSLRASAEHQIEQARALVQGRLGSRPVRSPELECADLYLDAAYVSILRLAPESYVATVLTNILMYARQHLPEGDPRRQMLEQLQTDSAQNGETLHDRDRNTVIATLQASQEAARHEVGQIRNLRSVILGVAGVTMLLALGIAIFGFWRPDALPMCFLPEANTIVCPLADEVVPGGANLGDVRDTASDLDAALILGVGLLGAAIAAATGLRQMTAGHDPYSLQVTLAIVKLPIGAVTAFLGILLLRAQFVPGLTALDSSAQIIGWAVLLGYAQQLFTHFVDRKAATLLDQAASVPEPARERATGPPPRPVAAAQPT